VSVPLFRHAALTASSSQWIGTIVMSRPVPMRVAAISAAILTIALALYLWFGEYTRKVRVTGQIVPAAGALKAIAPQPGRIVARHVRDGDVVAAGQVLYELSSERAGQGGGIDTRIDGLLASRRELLMQERTLQSQQLQQRERSLQARQQLIVTEIARLEQEIALQQARIISADKTLARHRSLREQGFVSEFQLTQYENDRSDQLARGQTLERAKLAAMRDLMQVQEEAELTASQIRLSVAQTDRALASLDQEAAEHQGRSRIQVLAPAAGTVTTLTAEPGQAVSAGMVLATLIPAGSALEAHLLAPSRAIGFIEPGQAVLLRLAAFPYQKFGQASGTVLRVEHSPIADAGSGDTSNGGNVESVYRIVVQLTHQSVMAYGKEQKFRAGMRLEADIRQDRRRLIEWVIDPLVSAAKGRAE
jgi:membrane fusion protein